MRNVRLHPHAKQRIAERGTTEDEVIETVLQGTSSLARFSRTRFVRNFAYNRQWHGRQYANKRVEAIAVEEAPDDWLVITVLVKFY